VAVLAAVRGMQPPVCAAEASYVAAMLAVPTQEGATAFTLTDVRAACARAAAAEVAADGVAMRQLLDSVAARLGGMVSEVTAAFEALDTQKRFRTASQRIRQLRARPTFVCVKAYPG
jgi:hypothetical protein